MVLIIIPIGIDKNGKWLFGKLAKKLLNGERIKRSRGVLIPPESIIKKIYLNEINTMPRFTPISMYPKLWQINGIKFSKLLDLLIKFSIDQYRQKQKLLTSYHLLNKWYVASKR